MFPFRHLLDPIKVKIIWSIAFYTMDGEVSSSNLSRLTSNYCCTAFNNIRSPGTGSPLYDYQVYI